MTMRSQILNIPHFFRKLVIFGIMLIVFGHEVWAAEIRIAVATNFATAIKRISAKFEASTGHSVLLISGSTGKHYAQIKNAAPFDIFFAADRKRPELLENEGLALSASRFTYAVGELVLWSKKKGIVGAQGSILGTDFFNYLAIANPKLAPYGKAAEEVLQALGLWDDRTFKVVQGENIGQTFQFVNSGNADLGFVAYAQLKQTGKAAEGSYWKVPQSLYTPIVQQAVLLNENPTAREFVDFIRSEESRQMIRDYGYTIP